MTREIAPTAEISIYIAGSIEAIREGCRSYCLDVGLCVTVTACDFVYTGGAESGARVGFINYPRFPSTGQVLMDRAEGLATFLMMRAHQHSASIVGPTETVWLSRRPSNTAPTRQDETPEPNGMPT